jgi:prolyl-tRNA synthetase
VVIDTHDKEVLSLLKPWTKELKNKKYRFIVDKQDKLSFSNKLDKYVSQGVPFVIKAGLRDLLAKKITIINRNTLQEEIISFSAWNPYLTSALRENQQTLWRSNLDNNKEKLITILTYDEYQRQLKINKGHYFIAPFCGDIKCEALIKKETGTTSRCIKEDKRKTKLLKCFKCERERACWTYFGYSY